MMRQLILFSVLLLVTLPCYAGSLETAAKELRADQAQDLAAAQTLLKQHQAVQAALQVELEAVQADLDQQQQGLNQRQAELQRLQQQTGANRQALAADEVDLEALQQELQTMAADVERLVGPMPLARQDAALMTTLAAVSAGGELPQAEQVVQIGQALLRSIDRGRSITRMSVDLVDERGQLVRQPVLYLPPLAPLTQGNDNVHFTRFSEEAGVLQQLDLALPGRTQQQLERFFHGQSPRLPMDLSLGSQLTASASPISLWQRIRQGGLVVWPILLIGLLAMVLVVERLFHLSRLRADTGRLRQEVLPLLQQGDLPGCQQICAQHGRNPAARVLEAGLAHAGTSLETVENAFHEAMLHQMPRLERSLPTLSVLAAVAPLLGLLGTVSGMIGTFQALMLSGSSQAGQLSGGISEALLTTQLGLAVAIPILLIHHFLERRVEKIVDRMEATVVSFTPSLARLDRPEP